MQPKHWFQAVKNAYRQYDRWMEKRGFGIVLAVCVLMIASSAAYTFHFRREWQNTAATQEAEAQMVDNQQAQQLWDVQQLVSSQRTTVQTIPTEAPFSFAQPVEGFLDRDFSMLEPQYFAAANYYRLHPGIDLQASYGAIVKACAAGTVLRVWEDHELGLSVRIRHANGYEAVYAGLSNASYLRQGDPVMQGQTIGHVGNGVLAETDAQPHLHLEVWLNQTPVDPVELFLGIHQQGG